MAFVFLTEEGEGPDIVRVAKRRVRFRGFGSKEDADTDKRGLGRLDFQDEAQSSALVLGIRRSRLRGGVVHLGAQLSGGGNCERQRLLWCGLAINVLF